MTSVFSSTSVKQQAAAMQRQLLGSLPKKLRGLAAFGLRALVCVPFVSCNANARMAGCSPSHAAEMRMTRLLRHTRLASLVMATVQETLPLTSKSVLNVDFSNFGGVAALVAALQTGKGRAVPWTLTALTSNTQGMKRGDAGYQRHKDAYQAWKQQNGGDQYDTVLHLVASIDDAATAPPCLVLDRGFSNKRLLTALLTRSGNSYIRFRDSYRLWVQSPKLYRGQWYVSDLPKGDYQVQWRGLVFRLVVATTGYKRQHNNAMAPWVIATNDHTSTTESIARLYYHRFEIEETFRDWKSGLGFRRVRLTRWQSLQVLLSFASVATLFAWLATGRQAAASRLQLHPKKQLSYFRCWHEAMQMLQVRLREPTALPGG